jgi:hypothetical protein
MLSSSVQNVFPFPPVLTPIKANILIISHPRAPAPIMNGDDSDALLTKASPNKTW